MEALKIIVDRRAAAEAKIAIFRSLFRGREDASVREPQDREIRLRASVRQRMGSRHLREAAHQMCGVSPSPIPVADRHGASLAPVWSR
jgi:hypothetical protein